jgi:beta-lactam-binding protein with PASTA domain
MRNLLDRFRHRDHEVSAVRRRRVFVAVQRAKVETADPEGREADLARVNCRVGKVSLDYSRTIKGLVIRQRPKLGAVLPRGSRVDVVISRGGRSQ